MQESVSLPAKAGPGTPGRNNSTVSREGSHVPFVIDQTSRLEPLPRPVTSVAGSVGSSKTAVPALRPSIGRRRPRAYWPPWYLRWRKACRPARRRQSTARARLRCRRNWRTARDWRPPARRRGNRYFPLELLYSKVESVSATGVTSAWNVSIEVSQRTTAPTLFTSSSVRTVASSSQTCAGLFDVAACAAICYLYTTRLREDFAASRVGNHRAEAPRSNNKLRKDRIVHRDYRINARVEVVGRGLPANDAARYGSRINRNGRRVVALANDRPRRLRRPRSARRKLSRKQYCCCPRRTARPARLPGSKFRRRY